MNNLVQRLLNRREYTLIANNHFQEVDPIFSEAATEISRLTAALATARNDSLEEAAEIADGYTSIMSAVDPTESPDHFAIREAADDAQMLTAERISHAIRALKEQKP